MKPWTPGKIKFMSTLMLLLADSLQNKYNLLDKFAVVNVSADHRRTSAEYYSNGQNNKDFNHVDY